MTDEAAGAPYRPAWKFEEMPPELEDLRAKAEKRSDEAMHLEASMSWKDLAEAAEAAFGDGDPRAFAAWSRMAREFYEIELELPPDMEGPPGRALARIPVIFGPDSPESLYAGETAALVRLSYLLDPGGARKALDGIAARAASALGEAHPQAVCARISLAAALIEAGDARSAAAGLRVALKTSSLALGDSHPVTLRAERGLAVALARLKDHEEALAARGRAMEKFERVWGQSHPETLNFMTALGMALLRSREFAAARDIFQVILERRRLSLGDDNLYTLRTMNHLSLCNGALGDWAAARDLLSGVLEGKKRLLGPDHPETVSTMGVLAHAFSAVGEDGKAQELLSELVTKMSDSMGPEHPESLAARTGLANVMLKLGKKTEAKSMLQEVMEARSRAPEPAGPADDMNLSSMNALTLMTEDMQAAKAQFKAMADAQGRALGASHPDTLRSLIYSNFASFRQGRHGEAKRSLTGALEQAVRSGGLDTYWVSIIAGYLGEICIVMGARGEAIFYEKLAVSSGLRARGRRSFLDEAFRGIYPEQIATRCRVLIAWLSQDGRAREADMLRKVLKEGSLQEPIPEDAPPEEGEPAAPPEASPVPAVFAGQPEEAAYLALASAAEACARHCPEREALKAKRAKGALTPPEKKRLSKLTAEAKAARQAFIETCGKIPGLIKPQALQ
ncbi:MAG: tetratricopeptide repeat protein [Deltaproteobacteria bacterium]|jgi:tetratricopeptide (TPR) repeat protein|nr:tetratricopeptide repeat protein [Deltaproteobacteria bacterium]